jgi:hypothetical protein
VLSGIGRSICDELITRSEEFYHVSDKIKKPKTGGQGPTWAVKATDDDDDEFRALVKYLRRLLRRSLGT